jgi:hypothetical protein
MNTVSLTKNNKNEGVISTIIMKDIIKRKNLLLLPTTLLKQNLFVNNSSLNYQNICDNSMPFLLDVFTNDSSIKNTGSTKTSSIHSKNSIQYNNSVNSLNSLDSVNSLNSLDSVNSLNSLDSVNSAEEVKLNKTVQLLNNIKKSDTEKENNTNSLQSNIINSNKNSCNQKNISDGKIYSKKNFNDVIIKKKDISNNYLNDDDDSELITNRNIKINIKENISQNKYILDNKPIKNSIGDNFYCMTKEDFIILSNLTLLSKVQPLQKLIIEPINNNSEINNNKLNRLNNKIYKINFEIKIDNSFVPKFTRWYYSQGRNETIFAINELVDVAIEQFFMYKNSNNLINSNKYLNLLENSKCGLVNLKSTYNTDNSCSASIENILTKISDFLTANNL